MKRAFVAIAAVSMACVPSDGCRSGGAPVPPGIEVSRDLDYGGQGHRLQRLDLYLPKSRRSDRLPLVIFFHGGAWEEGDKTDLVGMIFPLVAGGEFAGASVDYRLTDEGPHPMPIHDAKAAVRWLRAQAGRYGLDSGRFAAFGISAGGHLASLLGTSGGVAELEGAVGNARGQSSRVAAVVNFCGPSNLATFSAADSRIDPEDPHGPIGKLLGGPAGRRGEVARAASPVTYVTADDAAFLHIHGSADDVVPYRQTLEFDAALDAAGVSSAVLTGDGAGHVFYSDGVRDGLHAFLANRLLGSGDSVHDATVAPR